MSQELIDAITNMKEEEAFTLSKQLLDAGKDPMELLECCRTGMEKVGELFSEGKYYLPELMLAGEMLSQISEMTKSKMAESGEIDKDRIGKFLIGTVEGDIHDLGKNIVCFMMDINGFEVIDIGVDVPPETFVDAIKKHDPKIVGLCGLLTSAYEPMKQTIFEIEKAGLRSKVKIMIGGGAIHEEIKTYAGADAYGKDAVVAVNIAKNWMG